MTNKLSWEAFLKTGIAHGLASHQQWDAYGEWLRENQPSNGKCSMRGDFVVGGRWHGDLTEVDLCK